MFIPRGDIIYESLATSYVLVDALAADLCEGGFSGTIEVVLRDTDSFIIIAGGNLIAVLEKSGHTGNGSSLQYTQTSVEQLADRSRRERGRVSIYSYSQLTAAAIAGRINAKPLYIGLSTEFTDFEKMISKLSREHDREWFIEISRDDGTASLLHMRDSKCGVINSRGATDSGPLDLTGHVTLARLVDECTRVGGTVDVYFRLANEPIEAAPESLPFKVAEYSPQPNPIRQEAIDRQFSASEAYTPALTVSDETMSTGQKQFMTEQLFEDYLIEHHEKSQVGNNGSAVNSKLYEVPDVLAAEEFLPDPDGLQSRSPDDFSLVRDELPLVSGDTEDMNEIKRLMGEVARVIEEAAQAVGRPDIFSMSLRAGQLKIADRYPFLDPFAGEFEYLTGEIVFVGRATAAEFVSGFGEALKLAVQEVARSTAYADRFCSYVIEDLNKVLSRERAELEKYGIDKVIGEIVS